MINDQYDEDKFYSNSIDFEKDDIIPISFFTENFVSGWIPSKVEL